MRARYNTGDYEDEPWSGPWTADALIVVAEQALPLSTLSVSDAVATEGDDATLDFVVTLAPAAAGVVTVDYATSDGTATAGDDYTATSGTLTFAAGETTKTVSVPVLDDLVEDDGETVNFALSNASGASLGDGAAVGTIRNTEDTPAILVSNLGQTHANVERHRPPDCLKGLRIVTRLWPPPSGRVDAPTA